MPTDEQKPQPSVDEQLEKIVTYLHHLDRRDRLRTIWGAFHSVLAMIPLIILIVSGWYVYTHGDDVIKKITQETVKSMITITPQQQSLIEQFQGLFPGFGASSASSSKR